MTNSTEPRKRGPRPQIPGYVHLDRPWEELSSSEKLTRLWADPPGLIGWFRSVQNDAVGGRIMATALLFFVLGGINALLMRTQLAVPENDFLAPDTYNQLFTMHGSSMMYLFAVPILEGFAIMILPLMLGNREMPFPRLGMFSWFTFFLGGLLFYFSFVTGDVPAAGWFAYAPLSNIRYAPGIAMDYWLLALGVAEVAAIAAGVEIVIAILRMRAPGMSLSKLPLFAWSMLVMAFSLLFAFTPLIVGSLLLELDRRIGTKFFIPEAGGSPVLWQHIFWIFGHPEVYIQFIPAAGMVSMIIPVFSRRSLSGYTLVAMAVVGTGFLSFALWVHHMFTVGLPQISMTFFAAASMTVGIPAGLQIFAWITTIFTGRPVFKTPFLFVIGFLVIFVLGGITGIMVAAIPFDWQVHDSYFVVAHFHYVLIGGVVFPVFAAFYYWIPKLFGRLLNERLGKWHFWLLFIGFNVTFFPMHISGMLGMPRRVYTFEPWPELALLNLISTAGAFLIALAVAIFLVNLVYSIRRGEPAGDNPWGADSLVWATSSPPPPHGFDRLPIVRSRHPLWEQDDVREEDDVIGDTTRTERLVEALSDYPLRWRAALATSMLDAEPVEIFGVNGPSIWPHVAALGLVTVFGSEVYGFHWMTFIGIAIFVIAVIGWHWPNKIPYTEEERAFEEEFGIPVRPNGSHVVSRWGMNLAIMLLGVALASFLFTYFYIRLENPVWPPPEMPLPEMWRVGAATVAVLSGAAAMYWAVRSMRAGRLLRGRIALLLAVLFGSAGLGVMVWEYANLPFGWEANAYASLFWALGAYVMLLLTVGLGMNLFVQFWSWQGYYTALDHMAVENSSRFWIGITAYWVIAFAVVYLAPYLT